MKVSYEVDKTHAALWQKPFRYALLMGGRGNGRSGTASRYTISHLLGKEYFRGALMRATREDIRTSSWLELQDRMDESGISKTFKITDNDMHIEYGANSINAHGFKASSGSLTARLKSLAGYNFVWVEEAEETGEKEFITLDDSLRTVKGGIRIILSLNTPSIKHWIIKRWFNVIPSEIEGFYRLELKPEATDVLYIPGTFRENLPNLDPVTVARYQKYKETKPGYYWQYIEGLSPEVVMGRIYSGWQEIPSVPHEARLLGYGLDFGFDPDPAALVAVYFYNGGYILDECLYQTELTNDQLALNIKLNPKGLVIADSAEPKSIAEIGQKGVNIIPCTKGPDSVNFGIKHVQGLRISYTARSINLKNEHETCAWKMDKDGNNLGVEDPKCANHGLSAVRYFLSEMVHGKIVPKEMNAEERSAMHFAEAMRRKRMHQGGLKARKTLFL